MSDIIQAYLWGEAWSPLTIAGTGSVLTAVYYPHKATGDLYVHARGHSAHCCICDEDIAGTRPHTPHRWQSKAILAHLKTHGRRTRKQNKFIAERMVTA